MARAVTPFLMFDGVAEEAMKFYVSLFGDSEIAQIERTDQASKAPKAASKGRSLCWLELLPSSREFTSERLVN